MGSRSSHVYMASTSTEPVEGPVNYLQDLVLSSKGCRNIFYRHLSTRMRRVINYYGKPVKLKELTPEQQYKILVRVPYVEMSPHYCSLLYRALCSVGIHRVEQWFYTTDGILIPYLLTLRRFSQVSVIPDDFTVVDHLTKFSLENCAMNYANFQAKLKEFRKGIRKEYATGVKYTPRREMVYLYKTYHSNFPLNRSREDQYRYVLMWSQTRGTGLADSAMDTIALDKFVKTVTTEPSDIQMDHPVLLQATRGYVNIDLRLAKLSCGPTSVFESSRKKGGGVAFLERLCRRQINYTYDFISLDRFETGWRRVSTPHDVLCVCIEEALTNREDVQRVRAHTVLEPGKARVITVPSGYYQLMMSVFAHVFMGPIRNKYTRSGLSANRHMWNFMSDLNPDNPMWGALSQDAPIYGLSTDFSEATDYGNLSVARQIWDAIIEQASAGRKSFPLGLARLARDLYCGPREIIVNGDVIQRKRGWFMGDYMTKVILTVAQYYLLCKTQQTTASVVGDDLVILSNEKSRLEKHLEEIKALDFKISEPDTYITKRVIFYTEEGAFIPQRNNELLYVRMKMGKKLPYIDYPRTRLLLPILRSTDHYSSTNLGRFSLLGKEARYVHHTAQEASWVFQAASAIQMLMVPQDAEVLCPFTPIEIGGDGLFSDDPVFVSRMIHTRARGENGQWEVIYRMKESLHRRYMPKFLRNKRLTKTITKHHIVTLLAEEVKPQVPPEALVEPRSTEDKVMLHSFKGSILKDPIWFWAKLRERDYYRSILAGHREEPPPFPEIEKGFSGPVSRLPDSIIIEFLEKLSGYGIKCFSDYPYYVRSDRVEHDSYLNLGWDKGILTTIPTDRELVRETLDFRDANEGYVLDHIDDLPREITENLHLIIESDAVVHKTFIHQIRQIERDYPEGRRTRFLFVTRDRKCVRELMHDIPIGMRDNYEFIAVDPIIYNTGRTPTDVGKPDFQAETTIEIVDPGSVAYQRAVMADYQMIRDENIPASEQYMAHVTRLLSIPFTVKIEERFVWTAFITAHPNALKDLKPK